MNDTVDPVEFERKKKLFTFLPLFVLPILVLLFWGLGGGSSNAATMGVSGTSVGQVNTGLPSVMVEKEESKRDAYRQAAKEADNRAYALARDPYADVLLEESDEGELGSSPSSGYSDWEKKFAARTGNLEEQLNQFTAVADPSATPATTSSAGSTSNERRQRSSSTARKNQYNPPPKSSALDFENEDEQVAEIERAIANLNSSGAVQSGYDGAFAPTGGAYPSGEVASPDQSLSMSPEDSIANQQLATLDRIMERATYLQYPELAEDELRKRSKGNEKHLYPVAEAPSAAGDIKIFGVVPQRDTFPTASAPVARRSGFFTDESDDPDGDFTQLTVQAQVHNSVVVMDGSTIKLRLLEDVYVAGQRIPANTFVYGQGSLQGDRLRVSVSTITYRNNLYDVGLNVYDLDGQFGLAIPGSVERQIAKREASSAARSLGGATAGNGSLTSQLAAEGTETIKEIASRKLSVIKVELKAGHRVILRNK